ncbi:uncharacterized protein LOC119442512 [Dermacentor silvarum]|uniref:uncharacterized protein LOC119442512 n=1 Tax=Dermacentor silvarum TaxID=543639 RepID=UPI002101B658|nr:uncharacterized protein LOC119442512 [Dermacentor silvarum]
MTEMSVAEPAPGGAAGGKQDPVVPDAVVYLCSVVIVVMVVGGVIGLSILMKQRLDVNQNVTTAAPAGPGAPPPKARLVSVEDSESSDFKVFNDDDPFHYRVAKARDGYHRKVPFYEAAHSKQKAKRHKKVPTTRVTKAKRKTTKRAKATTKHKSRRLPVTHGVKTTAKHGKRKTNVAHKKDKTVKAATEATAIREIGALENISDVGVAGIEIKAKKNAAKNARNDTIGGDVDKGDVQVSAKKKVSAKERKRQAVVETMKVFLKSSSEAQPPNITINKSPPAPDSVNLSDVSDFIAGDGAASEAASGDDGVAEHKTIAIKLIKPAEIEKTSEVDNVASHNQSARAAVSGSSVNGTASNTSSLGNAPVTNESSDKAAPVISSRGNTSDGNTLVGNTVLTNSSSSVNKNSASHVPEAKEELSADSSAVNKSPKSASPVDESPVVESPSDSKSAVDSAGANKLKPAKPSAANGSPAKDATGKAAINQSVGQGPQTNDAQPIDSSAVKSPESVSPVDESPAVGSPAGSKSSVDISGANKLPPAKPSATNGSPAKDATGKAAVNQSVDRGSQTNNAQPLDASAASDKLPESASPVDESPAIGSPAGSKSPVDISEANKLPPAKPSASNGSPAKESTGKAAVNQSVDRGSQTNNAQPLDASAASDKSADKLAPVNEPPASAPSGAEKPAAAKSAEKSGDAGSAENNKGEAALPNQAVEEKHTDKSKDAAEHGADSLAPGPSAQRPLFCDVRKSILRPLASYCTHILFGRLSLVTSNGVIMVGDFDSATQEQLHLASVVRPGWPHVSLMATLGGGGEKNDIAMAKAFEAGDATLDALATEAANLVRKRGLDGLNVHWTVPDLEGDVEAYAVGLVAFIKKLRKELGPSSIITVVLPSEPEERNAAFNVRELQPLVNFLFVSTHDTFSPYSTLTHFNGPAQDIDTGGMFTAIADVMKQLNANQSRQLCFTFGLSGVAYKVDAGAPLAKYVPLVGAVEPSIAQSAPNAGQLPKEGQPITYDEVCKLNLTCHRAHVEKSCYDKVGDTWYGYVDEEAVASKAKWILKDGWENLCVVAWNVDADDVKGSCRGDAAASYPLLRSLSQATAALAY